MLICEEEGTSMHHLSTMPELLQPPLSLRVPCPEGIRQRRPRRERVCGRTSVCHGLGGASIISTGDPQRLPGGGTPTSLEQANGLVSRYSALCLPNRLIRQGAIIMRINK